MTRVLRRLFGNRDGTAAVETAILTPIFLVLTLGITDIGTAAYVRTAVNAATQAGAAFAVINAGSTCSPTPIAGACLNAIKTAMNDAYSGASAFCTVATCAASIGTCADGSPKCINVSVTYRFTPLLPDAVYSWTLPTTISASSTIRVL